MIMKVEEPLDRHSGYPHPPHPKHWPCRCIMQTDHEWPDVPRPRFAGSCAVLTIIAVVFWVIIFLYLTK